MPESPTTRQDSVDFRDLIYLPSLAPLRTRVIPDINSLNIRHQGVGGACTGFALAALIDNLNLRKDIEKPVSARMLYEMAKRHDQWTGESYAGSSARGAMKGWQKNGVCPESDWPYDNHHPGYLTPARQQAALQFPLGAYYRVNRRRSDLHAAICETGAVFVSTATHWGWQKNYQVKKGWINADYMTNTKGGHAILIIGYNEDGYIIQNSWGENWGGVELNGIKYPGCALWAYADAEYNMWDAWVARMALPQLNASAITQSNDAANRTASTDLPLEIKLREHYLHLDDGKFEAFGNYPSDENQMRLIIEKAVRQKHLLIYVHGGANNVKSAAKRAGNWRQIFEKNGIFEIHLIWESGIFEELKDIICRKAHRIKDRAGGISAWTDRYIERIAQSPGHALWNEMQADAQRAFRKSGAGYKFIDALTRALGKHPQHAKPQIHFAGHSAGAIWLARLLKYWEKRKSPPIQNMVLFAPACTVKLYNSHIHTAARKGIVQHLHHFQLDDDREKADNVATIYRKSMLYLISRSFQEKRKIVPIAGMQIYRDKLKIMADNDRVQIYDPESQWNATHAENHTGFDNDATTMNRFLQIILAHPPKFKFSRGRHLQD